MTRGALLGRWTPRKDQLPGSPWEGLRLTRGPSCRPGAGWRSESPAHEVTGRLGPITGASLTQAQPHPTLLKAVPATAPAPGSWGRGPPALDPQLIPSQPWCPIHSGGAHVPLSSSPRLFPQEGILTVSKVTLRPHWTPWMGCPFPPPPPAAPAQGSGSPTAWAPSGLLGPCRSSSCSPVPPSYKGGDPQGPLPHNCSWFSGSGHPTWDELGRAGRLGWAPAPGHHGQHTRTRTWEPCQPPLGPLGLPKLDCDAVVLALPPVQLRHPFRNGGLGAVPPVSVSLRPLPTSCPRDSPITLRLWLRGPQCDSGPAGVDCPGLWAWGQGVHRPSRGRGGDRWRAGAWCPEAGCARGGLAFTQGCLWPLAAGRGPKPSPLEPLEGASPVHTLTSAW